jgi:hypothetical protein
MSFCECIIDGEMVVLEGRSGFGLIVFFVFRGDVDFVLPLEASAKIVYAFAEGGTDFWKFAATENQYDNSQDQKEFKGAGYSHAFPLWALLKEERSALAALLSTLLSGSLDGVHGATVDASAAIGALFSVNDADVAFFCNGAHRTGVVAGTTVDAFFSNGIGQGIHLLFFKIGNMA